MDEKHFKKQIISSKAAIITATKVSSDVIQPRRRLAQNYLLLWVDANIDPSNKEYQNTLALLRGVVNDVYTFIELDECIDFLTEVDDIRTFLIVEGTLGHQIVSLIQDIPQLNAIYVFYSDRSQHEQWPKEWMKLKGVHTEIMSICESLQHAVKQCNQDTIAVSFFAVDEHISNGNLDQLEPLFMYTQIFKEILLAMKFDQQSVTNFITYCRNGDYGSPSNIARFDNEYQAKLAIWWYTYPSFIYSMLNYALRMLEADIIIEMGFFIHDLHCQIEELHHKQADSYDGKPFIVYRGQGLLTTDYEKLLKTKGGLMSFNNFLSTSRNREVSLDFAHTALTEANKVGILFRMFIDPSISSTPFASINEFSYYNTEEEILFSMHSVFRVDEIIKIDNNFPLYQVELKLTADDDEELRILTNRIRKEAVGSTGWQRLGNLLLKISQFDKAEELYKALLEQTSEESEKALYYNQLGYIKDCHSDYEKAIWYYEKMLEIIERALPPDHPLLATSHNNIAGVYDNMGEYLKALLFYGKALEIQQKTLPPYHFNLAVCYNNIGSVYKSMKEYSKALSYYEKAREIFEKTLPPNHPSLAISYGNIGLVYSDMEEYSKALSFYENALEIQQKTLPSNHSSFATSYNNIAGVYYNMREYSKTLSFYEKACQIFETNLPPNHPDLATCYNNIGMVYDKMEEYSKALSFYEKALEIFEKTLPSNHPVLVTCYNNIGGLYRNTGEYLKALLFFEKAFEIQQKTFPPNHPDLATCHCNIGSVYNETREYSKALPFCEKALEIQQKTLPPNYPLLSAFYDNISWIYRNIGEYSKALSFYEKALEIRQKTLPPYHPDLATCHRNIGSIYNKTQEYSKALSFFEKALEIQQKTLPPNHPSLVTSYDNIARTYYQMKQYSKALLFLENAMSILQSSVPSNHPRLESMQRKIESTKKKL